MAEETVTLRRIEGLINLAKINFYIFLIHLLGATIYYVMYIINPSNDDNNGIINLAATSICFLASSATPFIVGENIRIKNRGNNLFNIGFWIFVSCIAFVYGNALIMLGLEPLILATLGVVPFYIILSLVLSSDIALYLVVFISFFE
ncbi:hypothetical protein P8452_44601 [Trifolium repens]|nr:hypothetical protein P8452_44601 [Trifolium repens]